MARTKACAAMWALLQVPAGLVVNGTRVIGYDNERGKGDHRHVTGEENEYTFTSVDQLIEDFIAEVEQWKCEH